MNYRCESCLGEGYLADSAWVNGFYTPGPRVCDVCEGCGNLTPKDALAAVVRASHAEIMHGVALGTIGPRYAEQARAIGDARLVAFWDRVMQRVARLESARFARAEAAR